jgi:predicted ATPase
MSDLSTDEIEAISTQAFDLAETVAQDPGRRAELHATAESLREKLKQLATELRAKDPEAYEQVSDTVSEALLDLKYVIRETEGVSLRLNKVIQDQRADHPSTP